MKPKKGATMSNGDYVNIHDAFDVFSKLTPMQLVNNYKNKEIDIEFQKACIDKANKNIENRKRKLEIFKAHSDIFIDEITSYKENNDKEDAALVKLKSQKESKLRNAIALRAIFIHKVIKQECNKYKLQLPSNTELRLVMSLDDTSTPSTHLNLIETIDEFKSVQLSETNDVVRNVILEISGCDKTKETK